MKQTVWKSFKLGDLFNRKTPPNTGKPAKELNISEDYGIDKVALITRGEKNNGVVGYIDKSLFPFSKNKIIYNDQFGSILFHSYEFTTIKDHLSILEPIQKLLEILDQNIVAYHFITKMINKIFSKEIFNFNYSAADFKFPRELILLPVIEVDNKNHSFWEENGKYWTLDVDHIKTLMLEAKKRKEEKTIRLYEAERAKYEEGYLEEREVLVWKSFKLEELFDRNSSHSIKTPKKNLDESPLCDETHTIKNITASKENNGCTGYLSDEGEVSERKKKNMLTVASDAAYGGVCFYQSDEFVTTGHNNILEIKSPSLKRILDEDINLYLYLSKMITKVLKIDGVNRFMRPIGSDFDRELILLPVLESSENEDYIWEEKGKYLKLAKNTVSYLYLQGKINIQQRKIDSYSHPY